MNIILDVNIFHKFFKTDSTEHFNFAPVHKCIYECKGIVCFGGTQFKKEILKAGYVSYFNELNKIGKIKNLDLEKVDDLVKQLKLKEPNSDFDDPHLIACAILGKSKIICTEEKRACKYIDKVEFYEKSTQRPKVYKNESHSHLVQDCCKGLTKR